MWIDTHCHLDAPEFAGDVEDVVGRAQAAGVSMMLIPAVQACGFAGTARCARRFGFGYTLGIHPLYVDRAAEADLERLSDCVRAALPDPHFLGIGEIGLDFFVATPDVGRQERFYVEQLKLARELGLPVLLHVRRSADRLLKHLRRIEVTGGIAHAFNGSEHQAAEFVACGLRLGFGGAATFNGSLRIRRHAASLPADAIVLETDAPDIAPQWLHDAGAPRRNEPGELPRIAQVIAGLRGMDAAELALINRANAMASLPRLSSLLPALPAAH